MPAVAIPPVALSIAHVSPVQPSIRKVRVSARDELGLCWLTEQEKRCLLGELSVIESSRMRDRMLSRSTIHCDDFMDRYYQLRRRVNDLRAEHVTVLLY